ncbi:hypothetical protein [Frateuria sp. Soil773]|uniref:hypothetical protein n=1 Tax=Frateuria sp. Soil773 TaxID=1736407 RepID=UPI0012F7AB0D|nr:hypothetical protein [Frateuria sp. Soil773]
MAQEFFDGWAATREHAALRAELTANRKRRMWLLVIGFVGLAGTVRIFRGGEALAALYAQFGEFGVTFSYMALLVCGLWLARDYLQEKRGRARRHALYLKLTAHGYEYDFNAEQWKEPPVP